MLLQDRASSPIILCLVTIGIDSLTPGTDILIPYQLTDFTGIISSSSG